MHIRIIAVFFSLVVSISLLQAQSHNQNWLFGYTPNNSGSKFGGSILTFDTIPPEVTYFEIPFDFTACASYSNRNGRLLAYTNGCQISDADHKIIAGGDTINAGRIHDVFCILGYPLTQGVIFLPINTESDEIFRLVHLWMRDNFTAAEIRYSDLGYEENDDSVFVVSKDIVVDSLSFAESMTCVRHANGRDWWILLAELESARIHKYLSDPTGVFKVGTQIIGETWDDRDWSGQAVFSPDGAKYVRASPFNGIHIYSFDRCSGLLSDAIVRKFPPGFYSAAGAAFSSDSRFLYVSTNVLVYQYDMHVDSILESEVRVAEYDGFGNPFSTTFFQQMLAPDGKIYMTAPNSVYYLHIIHEPKKKGEECNVEQHALELPTRHAYSVPNFPYYRLGVVDGSVCDSLGISSLALTSTTEDNCGVSIYPNPASNYVCLELENVAFRNESVQCLLTGIDGKHYVATDVDELGCMNVIDVPPGMYILHIYGEESIVCQRRLIIMKND